MGEPAASGDGMYVALVRGINVGGNRKLPMKDLVAMFGDAGCHDAKSYIQSGNVVFRADASTAECVPAEIPSAIEKKFGFAPVVMVRSAAEVRAVARSNPFLAEGADEKVLHVAFLSGTPPPALVEALDLSFAAPEVARVIGREAYLYYPNGVGRAVLSYTHLEKQLGVSSTTRNWRTVQKLIALCDELE